MNIIEIPFVEKMGIQKNLNGELELPFDKSVHNHLETVHASAQFALAETSSGEILQILFPNLVGNVLPVLRASQIKFREPATSTLVAKPSVAEDDLSKFANQFLKKGRASISVNVKVLNQEGVITCTGLFNWFVQKIT